MARTAGDPSRELASRAATGGAGPGRNGGTDPAGAGHPRRWRILSVVAAVAFMAQLDLFIVNVALPAIGRSFGGADLSGLSWVLNAYAVVFAALLVPAGRLADHFGRRRFLLAGVAVFTLASAAAAVAPSLSVLVAARAVQAAGAAMIVPTSLGLLYPAFARHPDALIERTLFREPRLHVRLDRAVRLLRRLRRVPADHRPVPARPVALRPGAGRPGRHPRPCDRGAVRGQRRAHLGPPGPDRARRDRRRPHDRRGVVLDRHGPGSSGPTSRDCCRDCSSAARRPG